MSSQTLEHPLIQTITSIDPSMRDRPLLDLVAGASAEELLEAAGLLEAFRKRSENLYHRVRAAMFLHAIYRYALQEHPDLPAAGGIPHEAFADLMSRRFEEAIGKFLAAAKSEGWNQTLSSGLAQAYEQLAYQNLADQVRRSVRGCSGNRWMFRVGRPPEHPLRIHPRLLERGSAGLFPILAEKTPVRLDLSHSCWSDIFFLGMDHPEGTRVLNISVDLGVYGRDEKPAPPITTYARVIDEPLLRLTSLDLDSCKDVSTLEELFNFGNDYLGLVKAGVIASGLVPPSFEGTGIPLEEILGRVLRPGLGIEVVTQVNDIPKGSRLAVSTNLLASLVSVLMRATSQTRTLTGGLDLEEARVVVARAILGEWLGGSGGGWQDSGGVFPGVKIIEGVAAGPGDPEEGVSRGRLLPIHHLLQLGDSTIQAESLAPSPPADFASALASSLVLVHGGMAQNVGPILNMVTQKYLLRSKREWVWRKEALSIFERIVASVKSADVKELASLTTKNWEGPLKGVIPWVSNHFTETIISMARERLGQDFWGFLMLGGMSGGGMAFFVAPHRKAEFRDEIGAILSEAKSELEDALPFAMEPVVYDFRINSEGTFAELLDDRAATMPAKYYTLQIPKMIADGSDRLAETRKRDVDFFANSSSDAPKLLHVFRTMINNLFPVGSSTLDPARASWDAAAERIKVENGFDAVQHARLREDLQRGRIGLARNRLPNDAEIKDAQDDQLVDARSSPSRRVLELGEQAIREGRTAVVSLAAGVGSRWTTGAGVVKAINPFVSLAGRHRTFLEIHLAQTNRVRERYQVEIPHVVTTSFLTHQAVAEHLAKRGNYGHKGPVVLSRGQSIGARLVPMIRDLVFLWEEQPHETLDENKQKVREAGRRAIMGWAKGAGEGSDYADNVPIQRFNPPGHFHEIPNMFKNGVLAELFRRVPDLEWLMVHNIDTLGAWVDPAVLGLAIETGSHLSFEVIPRRIDDRGGGLANVNGRLRLLEGLAQPREETELDLRYYNTLTTWVNVDGLLGDFQLSRDDVSARPDRVAEAVRAVAARIPTYVTIKDVKRRWGHGQEDVYPVAQFEKLWGDMTSLSDVPCSFLAVDRSRGRQLKDASQLDGWANDGGQDHVVSLCRFSE